LELSMLSFSARNGIAQVTEVTHIVGLLQCLTGIWLMYCTWAVTVNLALGLKLWI